MSNSDGNPANHTLKKEMRALMKKPEKRKIINPDGNEI